VATTKVTISSNGRVTIPKVIRDRLKLRSGTQVALDLQGEQLVMKRLVPAFPDWRTMRGMVSTGPSLTKALEKEHREEIVRDEERLRRLSDIIGHF
jgi:AbrB family looped-hinge helix DNA binding protein